MHIVIDGINNLLYNYAFTFMLTCVKTQFQGPSREIGRLLSNTSNVMARLKKVRCFLKKCLLFLSG